MYFLELYFIYFVRWGTCLPQPMCRSQKQLFQMSVLSFYLVFKSESHCFSHRFLSFQESPSFGLAQVSGSFTCCSPSLVLDLWTLEVIKDSETKRFENVWARTAVASFIIIILCMDVLPSCLHIGPDAGHKRALDSLKLELQIIASCHLGVGESNFAPLKEQPTSALSHWTISLLLSFL